MKPVLKIATHLAAVGLGVFLAAKVLPQRASVADDAASGGKSRTTAASHSAPDGKAGRASRATSSQSRSAAFRAAWAALAKEPLTMAERFTAQKKLLAEWAKIDLHGALQAYLGEAWDNRNPARPMANEPLGDAFAEIFKEQPMQSWEAIRHDGILRNRLGWIWMNRVAQTEPGLVVAMMAEFPERVQAEAVAEVFSRIKSITPEKRAELLAKLTTSGTPEQVEKWLSQAYRETRETGDPAELSAKWQAMPAGGARLLQMTAWASSLRGADLANFSAEWDKIPADDRGQAARMLLTQVDNQSPALLEVIERGIEAEQWETFGKNDIAGKLRGFQTDRQQLAEWALTLPPREEVRSVYNLAISEKLLADPAAGREWLEQRPAGDWHRERGFIEMALGSLWVKGDIGAANRAIDAITDTRAKEEAIKCRYDWQLITSQKGVTRVE